MRRCGAGGDEAPDECVRPYGNPAENHRVFWGGRGADGAAGCEIVVDAKDLAVVGITEILSHLPKILGLTGN